MFDDINEIPENTPLMKDSENIDELMTNKVKLEEQRDEIMGAIELLLGK